MKIRTGFVSNSSSSSFIILGRMYDTSQKNLLPPEKEWMEIEKRCGFSIVEGYEENGIPDGKIVVGERLEGDTDTNQFPDGELDVSVTSEKLDAAGFPAGKMKVFFGTALC